MARYKPKPKPQNDGTTWWHSNCTWAVTGEHIDAATLGRQSPSPGHLRDLSDDTSGGSSYTQNQMVAQTYYGVRLYPRTGTRENFHDGVVAGRRMSASISCRETHNTKRETNDFLGTHTVFVNDYRWVDQPAGSCKCELAGTAAGNTDHGEYEVEDPGTTSAGYLWWSAKLLYRAMEARTDLYGGEGLLFMVGPDTEGAAAKMRVAGNVRSGPGGGYKDVGDIAAGTGIHVYQTTGTTGSSWAKIGTGRWVWGVSVEYAA